MKKSFLVALFVVVVLTMIALVSVAVSGLVAGSAAPILSFCGVLLLLFGIWIAAMITGMHEDEQQQSSTEVHNGGHA